MLRACTLIAPRVSDPKRTALHHTSNQQCTRTTQQVVVAYNEREHTSELDNPPSDSAAPPPPVTVTPAFALRFFGFALEDSWSISTFGHLRALPYSDIALLRKRVQAPSICCASKSLVLASRPYSRVYAPTRAPAQLRISSQNKAKFKFLIFFCVHPPFFFFFFTHLLSSFWTSRVSQVSPLLPPGSCLRFLSRIGFSNPTARQFFIECC